MSDVRLVECFGEQDYQDGDLRAGLVVLFFGEQDYQELAGFSGWGVVCLVECFGEQDDLSSRLGEEDYRDGRDFQDG